MLIDNDRLERELQQKYLAAVRKLNTTLPSYRPDGPGPGTNAPATLSANILRWSEWRATAEIKLRAVGENIPGAHDQMLNKLESDLRLAEIAALGAAAELCAPAEKAP